MSEQSSSQSSPRQSERTLLAVILLGLMLQAEPAIAAPLRGSATYIEQAGPVSGKPYYPRSRSIWRANRLVEDYKLGAAKDIYQAVLQRDPSNAAAHNGLGKVSYYLTTSSNQNLRNDTDELYQQAIQHFMKALSYQPNYVEARLNLGTIYLEQGRLEEAREMFHRAWQLAPNDADANERMGEVMVRQGRHNDAYPYLKQSISLKSGNATAHYNLGIVYTERGEYDLAHKALQTALYLDPNSAPVHYRLGVLYEDQGNGAAAVNEYKKAIEIKPELTEAGLKLASYYESRGDYTLALEQLKNVLDSESADHERDWSLYERIGKLSLKNKQPQIATHYYRKWLAKNPGDGRAEAALSKSQTQLAKMKLQDNDLAGQGEARRAVEQALTYSPDNFEAKLIQARLDEAIDDKPKPDSRMLDVALQTSDLRPHQTYRQGEAYLERYQFSAAETAFKTAMRSAKTTREYLAYGSLMMEKAMPHLAEEAFNIILAQLPDNSAAKIGRGQAREARGKSLDLLTDAKFHDRKNYDAKAIHLAEEALKLNIRNEGAHYFLAVMYERRKEYGKAADHYYAYLNLVPAAENRKSAERKLKQLKLRLAQNN